GLAHLVEHLMFTGSIHIPSYDDPIQNAGGENNAYTSNDLTNYYSQIPYQNVEIALWLESDRMLGLALTEKSIEVQKKVVCEEFKEHYINKPYGDAWKILRELTYKKHPYQWITIGKELSHIEKVNKSIIEHFLNTYYMPNNAILCIAGNIQSDTIFPLISKYFDAIPSSHKPIRNLPEEPLQEAIQKKEIYRKVPLQALYLTFHIGNRSCPEYHTYDLITEILGGSNTSLLYQKLVKEKRLFSNIECYHFGSLDQGILAISGKLLEGVDIRIAEQEIWNIIDSFLQKRINIQKFQKYINKTKSLMAFEDLSLINRATNLSFYELLGDANMINTELEKYEQISPENILSVSQETLVPKNAHVLYYLPT
ncbi:MAG: M16 family metallopeptidase, partial [Chitinophagaceae bacterium]